MMKKDIQKSIEIYKEQLDNGYIQVAYLTLTKYVLNYSLIFPKNIVYRKYFIWIFRLYLFFFF